MSLGYAEKLSYRDDLGGKLGAPELFDSPAEVERKVTLLAELIKCSHKIIAFTGAGISTSIGVPDFRGPNGIWTLQRSGKPIPKPKISFAVAKPSFTHGSLVALMQTKKLTYIVSQNVDGIHLRSGIPRPQLAELHGNCFSERCNACSKEYIRDFEVETVGFKETGRLCTQDGCTGRLQDHVLDWEDALPEDELQTSEQCARDADLAICLGTSLQITPACNLPLKTIRAYKNKPTPGKLVIINLQRTQHDKRAEKSGGLVIHARTDDVMKLLVEKLGLSVPPYLRQDSVHICHRVTTGSSNTRSAFEEDSMRYVIEVCTRSIHGVECPHPMIKSIAYKVKIEDNIEEGVIGEHPFVIHHATDRVGVHWFELKLHLVDEADADKRIIAVDYDVEVREEERDNDTSNERVVTFTSQVVDYHAMADDDGDIVESIQPEEEKSIANAREKKRKRDAR